MGFDLVTVPVRLEAEPMRTIKESAEAWEIAAIYPPFASVKHDPLPRVSREILKQIPDGFERTDNFPDRSYDAVMYLMDPSAYRNSNWEELERSLPYRIIYGDQHFATHAKGIQGVPWRCSTSNFLADAAARIDAINPSILRRQFSVNQMVNSGVYKARRSEDDDETFKRHLVALRQLAHYYNRLAGAGLDLVVIRD